jgi:hypothetical protein
MTTPIAPPPDDGQLPKGAGRLPKWWMLLTPHETVEDWSLLAEKKAEKKKKLLPPTDVEEMEDHDGGGDSEEYREALYAAPSTDELVLLAPEMEDDLSQAFLAAAQNSGYIVMDTDDAQPPAAGGSVLSIMAAAVAKERANMEKNEIMKTTEPEPEPRLHAADDTEQEAPVVDDAPMEAPAVMNVFNSFTLGMTGLVALSEPSETDDAFEKGALEAPDETDDTVVEEAVLESVDQAPLDSSTAEDVAVTEEPLVVAEAVDDEPQNMTVEDVVATETVVSERVVDVTKEPPAPMAEDPAEAAPEMMHDVGTDEAVEVDEDSESPEGAKRSAKQADTSFDAATDQVSEIMGPEILRPLDDRHRLGSSPEKSPAPERAAGQHLLKKSGQKNERDSNSDHAINSNPSEATGDAGAEARKLDSGKVVPAAETSEPRVYKTAFMGVSPFDFAMQQRAQEKERRQKEKMDREGLTRHHAQVVQIESATELKKKQQEELRLKKEAEDLHKNFKNDAGPSQFDTAGTLKKLALEQKNAKKEAEQRNHEFQAKKSFVIRK